MNDIEVSILCITYNHEEYIKKALDGFVSQKTNFNYEVLINDDASTDSTACIIKEYEKKYPKLIRGIYQSENKQSKGISIIRDILIPKARGKYIAICEGDDYWTDETKIQKQYDIMEAHPEINICAHATEIISSKSGKSLGKIIPRSESCIISVNDVIKGGGGFVATSSLFYRKKIETEKHDFFNNYRIDYFLQVCGSLNNGMYYLDRCMSVYRWMSKGSWTSTVELDPQKRILSLKKTIESLNLLNEETCKIYDEVIQIAIREREFAILVFERNIKKILKPPYREIYEKKSISEKIKIQFKCRVPFAYTIRRLIKR